MLFENVLYYGADFRFHPGDVETDAGRITAVRPRGCTPRAMLLPGPCGHPPARQLRGGLFRRLSGRAAADGALPRRARHDLLQPGLADAAGGAACGRVPHGGAVPCGAACGRGCAARDHDGRAVLQHGQAGRAEPGAPAPAGRPDVRAGLQQAANGLIRIACVAPELPGALPFIRKVAAEGIAVSVAHTEADYDAASAAFDAGASHVTHLYNAMPPLLHRAPGVIGAAAEREQVTAELIVDGIHVHPSAVRAAFRLFGPGRICLISDALSACGMPDGDYTLGGQAIRVRGARATLLDGTLAGSAATLFGCMKNAVRFGVPPEEAVRAASHTPARVIGAAGEVGAIREGLAADLLLCSMDWELLAVYAGGQLIRKN